MSTFAIRSMVLALTVAAEVALGAVRSVPGGSDWSRYQVILDREPFGSVPRPGAGDAAEGSADAVPEEPQGPALSEIIRLSVVTLFGGRPAAGFTDTSKGRAFYLFEGESIKTEEAVYTLVSVDADGSGATLRKGLQEEHLRIGAAGGASPAPSAAAPAASAAARLPAVAEPSDVSYAALQRRRIEAARQRATAARRIAEEEKRHQDERAKRLADEALQKHLREYNLNLIRTGSGPPLPIELTPEEVAQLAAEGFNVQIPDNIPPDAPQAQ